MTDLFGWNHPAKEPWHKLLDEAPESFVIEATTEDVEYQNAELGLYEGEEC